MARKIDLTPNAKVVLKKRYLQKGETFVQLFDRIARYVAQAESNYNNDENIVGKWSDKFYELMTNLDFLPNCVSEDSLVATSKGYEEIGNITTGNIDVDVYTDEDVQVASKCFVNGEKEVYKITTVDGYSIKTTLEHMFRIIDEKGDYVWRSVIDLIPGDWLTLQKNHIPVDNPVYLDTTIDIYGGKGAPRKSIKFPIELDEVFAEWFGYYVGDGCNKKNSIEWAIYGSDSDMYEWSNRISMELFGIFPTFVDVKDKNCRVFVINRTNLLDFLSKNSLLKNKSDCLNTLPKAILKSSVPVVRSFLRGLFEADGTIGKRVIELYSASHLFLSQVQLLLLGIGIKSILKPKKEGYRLTIRKDMYGRKFVYDIGFISKRKKKLADIFISIDGKNKYHNIIPNQWSKLYKWYHDTNKDGYVSGLYKQLAYFMTDSVSSRQLSEDRYHQLVDTHFILSTSPINDFITRNQIVSKLHTIEYIGKQKVRDLHVPHNNTYVVNGFVSHNSPTIKYSGSGKKGCLSACCVLGIDDSRASIFKTLQDTVEAQARGLGTGYNFSRLRPKGDTIESTGGFASGPLSFMSIYDVTVGPVIAQGGFRRGAQMGILSCEHPDIFDFVLSKRKAGILPSFNLSVGVTDAFMETVKKNGKWDLKFNGKVYRTVKARDLWDKIIEGAWHLGEPGVVFLDRINRDNPLYDSGYIIESTNPCCVGETKVAVADGRHAISFKQLAEEGKDVPVYTQNDQGNLCIRMMRNPRITGYNRKILKITLDDGNSLRVTENHKFVLFDNSIKEAKDLVSGDSLSIMIKKFTEWGSIYNLRNGTEKCKIPYWNIKTTTDSKWKREHRLIYDFYFPNSINGKVVHHKDNNTDNNIYNLDCMTASEHNRYHISGDKNPMRTHPESNWMLDADKQREMREKYHVGAKRTDETKRNIGKTTKDRFDNDSEFRKRHSQAVSKAMKGNEKFNVYIKKRSEEKRDKCQELTDLPCILVDNKVHVEKKCESCGTVMVLPWFKREYCFCNINCCKNAGKPIKGYLCKSRSNSNGKSDTKEFITIDRHGLVKSQQIKVYLDIKFETGTEPTQLDWEHKCKMEGVPSNLGNMLYGFSTYTDLQQASIDHNHRVVSVEFDGYEDVYNGTVDDYHKLFIGHFDNSIDGTLKYVYTLCCQCGEQPLPVRYDKNKGYSNGLICNLGSINLANHYSYRNNDINWERLKNTVHTSVRFLDNVIDVNYYPLEGLEEEVKKSRLIGLGVMGWADLLLLLRISYNSDDAIELARKVGKFINDNAKEASIKLGEERGAYPLWKEGNKINPEPIRNAARTTIAPTGSLSIIAGCSGGIEPNFAWEIDRSGQLDGHLSIEYHPMAEEYLVDNGVLPEYFVTTRDVPVEQHINMLAAWQENVNNAVSKCVAKGTVLITNKGFLNIEDFGNASVEGEFVDVLSNDIMVLDSSGTWRKVIRHYYDGRKETIKIRLSNGAEIEGSSIHKLMTVDGWKTLSDLSVGDHVAVSRKLSHYNGGGNKELSDFNFSYHWIGAYNEFKQPTHMNSDLAELLGALVSDGHLETSTGYVGLSEKNTIVGNRFVELFKKVFDIDLKKSEDKRNGVVCWYFNSIPLCLWLKGLVGYRSSDKHIPIQIMHGSKSEQEAFIRGVTLDGYKKSYSNRNAMVIYEGKSKQLAFQLFTLCVYFGMSPRIHRKYLDLHDYYVYGVQVANYNDSWEDHKKSEKDTDFFRFVRIPSNCFDSNLISKTLRQSWKRRKSKVCKDTTLDKYGIKYDDTIEYFKVTDKDYSVNDLYDIEVEGSHEYLIDGVISHNTINAPNNATIDNVDRAFMQAFDMGCKGVTYYRDGSRQFQSLATVKHKKKRKNGEKYELPEVMNSRRINMTTLKGKASLFIVLDDRNIPVEFYVNPPIESPETAAIMTAICRLIAVGVQGYEDLDEYLDQLKKANKMYENKNQILTYIIKALQGAKRRKNNYNINVIKDLPLEEEDMVEVMAIYNIINLAQTGKDDLNDYISVLKYTNKEHGNVSSVLSFLIKAFNKFTEVLNAEEGKVVVTKENCPDCGHKMILKEGCDTCPNCSYSKCG